LPNEIGLQSDRVEIRIVESNGHAESLHAYPQSGVRALRKGGSRREPGMYQAISIPAGLYKTIKDKPVRLELEYSLTLFPRVSSRVLPPINGERQIPGVGRCATRINNGETAIQLRCETFSKPVCMTAVLEHTPSGQRNPERFACEGMDYGPYIAWHLMPDSLSRFGANLPFRDQTALARYPVDGSKLPESEVVIHVYEAAGHFTQKLAILGIRLGDWEAE